MRKPSECLKELAKVIGWQLVNEDNGFCNFEYEIHVSKHENDLYVVRILDEPNELETRELLIAILKVLPYKLKRKVDKLLSKFKMEDFANLIEVVCFTIEEYRKATDFAKLERSPKAIKFIEESLGIEEKCKECNYYRLCKNGCKRERIDLDKCTAYKNFFPYALPHLKRMH